MLQSSYSYSYHSLTTNILIPLSHSHPYKPSLLSSPLSNFPYRPTTPHHVSALPPLRPEPLLAQVPEPEEGPMELPPSSPSIFATTDNPSTIQVATSVLLTGAISVFLFRSVRRRAKRAKELVFFLSFIHFFWILHFTMLLMCFCLSFL